MTPHMEAIAFRIWQVAEPVGWNLTIADAAEMAGLDASWAGRVAKEKGWDTRFRASKTSTHFIDHRVTQYGFGPIEMGWI